MQDGLDPTLGAILPLVGVLIGVLGSGVATWRLKVRDEEREFRARARVLVEALTSTADYIEGVIDTPHMAHMHEDAATSVRRELWEQHELAVARHVVDSTSWQTISHGFERAIVAGWIVAGAMGRPRQRALAEGIVADMRSAAEVLWHYAYPDLPLGVRPAQR